MPANQSTPEHTRAEELIGWLTYDEEGGDEEFMREPLGEDDLAAGCTQIPVYAAPATPARGGDELREALRASLAKRSQPAMDPPYTAAFNAALDMVARDVAPFLASTDMAGASVPDRLARRMGAEFIARDDVPQVEGLTSGEGFTEDKARRLLAQAFEDAGVTGYARHIISGRADWYWTKPVIAAMLAASPKAAATASVREDCAAACDRIATGSVYIGESEEGRARHEGIIAGARNCAAAIRRLTDSGTAATIGGERA